MAPMIAARGETVCRRTVLAAILSAAGLVTLGGCSDPTPPAVDRLRLATGPPGAVYREIGAAFAQIWNAAFGGDVVEVIPTDAALQNSLMLRAGEAELGFVNVDVAQTEAPMLVALFRAFDSVLHLVVPVSSPVTSVADLQDRSVAMGLAGSGTRFTAERLLRAVGVTVEPRDLSQADAAEALRAGHVDALMSLTAMPTPAISSLVEGPGPAVRFLDLADPAAALIRRHPEQYLGVAINAAVYPGIEPVSTLAVPTLLTSMPDLTDDIATFLVATVFEHAEQLRALRPEAGQLNLRTAIATVPVPLHPAAAGYFRSVKL